MKKTYFKPLVKIVNVEAETSLLQASTIETRDVPTDYGELNENIQQNGVGNGEGDWDF